MKTEEQVNDEYQIPVLVTDKAILLSVRSKGLISKVVMCKRDGSGYRANPGAGSDEGYWMNFDGIIPFPTKEQVEAERAKLRPKADPLPDAVRKAIQAPNGDVCAGARLYVNALIEAIYANPPKVQE